MGFDWDNFKVSGDILALSPEDFKALMKQRYGKGSGVIGKYLTNKQIDKLYNQVHGIDPKISESTESSAGADVEPISDAGSSGE